MICHVHLLVLVYGVSDLSLDPPAAACSTVKVQDWKSICLLIFFLFVLPICHPFILSTNFNIRQDTKYKMYLLNDDLLKIISISLA